MKFIPDYIIGVDKVTENESEKLFRYSEEDTKNFVGKVTESSYASGHNLFISSPLHSNSEDQIDYAKYDNILRNYIVSYISQLTDKEFKLNLLYYTNIYAKGQYAAPHYDGGDFVMIYYCNSDKENQPTSLNFSGNWNRITEKFEKLPDLGNASFNFYGERGDILIFPAYILHWVLPNRSEKERTVVACNIGIEFDK